MPARPTAARKNSAAPVPPAWQTTVTVLLIVHLFSLGLGLATNSGAGKSLLAPALREIPVVRPYLQLLWMDIPYDIQLASPLPQDGTHSLEIDVSGAALESDVDMPVMLPPADMQPRIRRQRYQQLAYHVAYFDELFAENSDLRTELPLAIAEQTLRGLKAPHRSYVMRCLREPAKRLPKAVERAPSKPREGGPRLAGPALYETVTIIIHLVWNPDDGKYQASRAEATGLTSEVVRQSVDSDETETDANPDEDDVADEGESAEEAASQERRAAVMATLKNYFGELNAAIGAAWNRFWFTPTSATTLGAMRIAVGMLSLYTIATFAPDLERWFSPDGMLPAALVQELFRAPPDAPWHEQFGQWSLFDYLPPSWLWPAYWLSLAVLAAYTLGVGGRTIAILAAVTVLSYFSRVPPTTGEFEIILAILLVYLCIGRTGDAFSLASWRRPNSIQHPASSIQPPPSAANTIALRLLQIHLAAVHLLMGWAQLAGPESSWWSGEGIWLAAMRPGMALVDFSFLTDHPRVVGAWSHVITLYLLALPVFVWIRLTRPLVLAVGVFVWVSLALASGWVMFCLAMLTGLLAYVEPQWLYAGSARREMSADSGRAA